MNIEIDRDHQCSGELDASVRPGNHNYSEWMRFALTTDQADPFSCTPAWQIPFHAAFTPRRKLVLEESEGAVLTFAKQKGSSGRFAFRPLESHWGLGCPALGENATERVSELVNRFADRGSLFRGVEISGVRPNGTLAQELERTFHRFELLRGTSSFHCTALLVGGMDGYLSRRPSQHRKNLRRELRRASACGVSFDRACPTTPSEARIVYARMLDVERRSWKGVNRCGMTEPPADTFYGLMIEWLSLTKDARVIFAQHDNRDIGFIFGGMAGTIYRGQQFSFDDGWKNYSIGNLLQLRQVEWLCEAGASRYDMGPSREAGMEYKRFWTESEVEFATWVIKMPEGCSR